VGVNKALLAIILIVMVGALWTTWHAAQEVYRYISLQARVPAEDLVWNTVARDSEHHFPQATYTYRVDDRVFNGSTVLSAPSARNRWAAQQLLPEIESTRWYVWYYPANPSFATLERSFPLKETLYSGMMWGIIAYFIALAWYIERR
jgi:hypothetical protein